MNTVKRKSKRENSESESEKSRLFDGANLVLLPALDTHFQFSIKTLLMKDTRFAAVKL